MSVIKKRGVISHFQGTPTAHVVHLREGQILHAGVGQAFWFKSATDALSEVAVTDQELPALFHAYTIDHQDVSVQITLTYRFADPQLAAQRLDFGIYPRNPQESEDGLTQARSVLTRLAQSIIVADIGARTLETVISNIGATHAKLLAGFGADTRLADIGIAVIDLQVLAIRPTSDIEKALQTPLREQIQAEADRATYERRALAVERERTISENELASRIELATRTELLLTQEGANTRREAEENAAAALIIAQGEAERQRIGAEAQAEAIRVKGEAEAMSMEALMGAYEGIDQELLKTLALRDLAQGLPAMRIGDVTITPDLLTKVLSQWGQK